MFSLGTIKICNHTPRKPKNKRERKKKNLGLIENVMHQAHVCVSCTLNNVQETLMCSSTWNGTQI